jgi:hypothetical protein
MTKYNWTGGSYIRSDRSNTPYDYYIYIDPDDSQIKARNGHTGAIDYSDPTNADVVINGAINSLSGPLSGSTIGTASGPFLNVWHGGKYGCILVGPGNFSCANSIVLYSNILLTGCGPQSTIFTLQANHADNANSTVMKSSTFDSMSFSAPNTVVAQHGDVGIRLAHFGIAGNKANNSTVTTVATTNQPTTPELAIQSWGFGIALYGNDFYLEDIEAISCRGAGICITSAPTNYSDGTYPFVAYNRMNYVSSTTNGQQGFLIRGSQFILENFLTASNGEAGVETQLTQYWNGAQGWISRGLCFLDGQNHANETKSSYNEHAYEWRITGNHVYINDCWVEGPAGPGDVILLGIPTGQTTSTGTGYELGRTASQIIMDGITIDNCKYAGIRGSIYAVRCMITGTQIKPNVETTWGSQSQLALQWEGGAGNVIDVYIRDLPSPADTTIYHPALVLGNATNAANSNDITIHAQSCQYLVNWKNPNNIENIITLKHVNLTDVPEQALAFFTPDSVTVDYTRNIIKSEAVTSNTSTFPITGMLSKNGGSATITGATGVTAYTIAHGLFTTPSIVEVVPANAAAVTAGTYYLTASTSNITVNFTTAPSNGSSNQFWWNARVNTQA